MKFLKAVSRIAVLQTCKEFKHSVNLEILDRLEHRRRGQSTTMDIHAADVYRACANGAKFDIFLDLNLMLKHTLYHGHSRSLAKGLAIVGEEDYRDAPTDGRSYNEVSE